MAEETIMVLRVDLGCPRCYKKVKKLLCRYSEIRDQNFLDKEDTVIIKVVCCNPERIRSKLICKSDGVIKSIEIRKPEKPKPPPAKPIEVEKPKPSPAKPIAEEKPNPPPPEKPPKPADLPKPDKPVEKPTPPTPKPAPAPAPAPVPGYPHFIPFPVCCKPCYEMGYGGPCQHGYGVPYRPPPSSYEGYVKLLPSYGEPSSGGWSSGCRCNRSYGCRCHCEYFTEENPPCTIM